MVVVVAAVVAGMAVLPPVSGLDAVLVHEGDDQELDPVPEAEGGGILGEDAGGDEIPSRAKLPMVSQLWWRAVRTTRCSGV